MVSSIGGTPVRKYPFESTRLQVRTGQILGYVGKPDTLQRCLQHLPGTVECGLTIDMNVQFAPVFFEFPGVQAAVRREPQVDAAMLSEILRHFRYGSILEVSRRSDDGHADIRAEAYGNHVLCDLLARAHAGIVPFGNNVGEPVIDDDFDLDVGYRGRNSASFGNRIVSAA